MQQRNSTSTLASYATLKSLADEKKYKSPYQILREFIRYIIATDSLYTFSAVKMKSLLDEHFGFSIPEAVIKTSVKGLEGVSLNHGIYKVSLDELRVDSRFEEVKNEANENESFIVRLLSDYIASKIGDSAIDETELVGDLTHFLTEDQSLHLSKYTEIIGEFILKTEHDKDIQQNEYSGPKWATVRSKSTAIK